MAKQKYWNGSDWIQISPSMQEFLDHLANNVLHTAYTTCATAVGTTAKVASLTGFTLVTGSRVTIKFTNANTASAPTLNINNTGAKAIWLNGTQVGSGGWEAGAVIEFVYDGTRYNAINDAGIGRLCNLETTNKNNLVAAVNELFTNVSSGKIQVAAAITDKGVNANGSDTFSQLASKIGQIATGKKWASGITSSSATTMAFRLGSSGTSTVSRPFITVSGLDFIPNFIIASTNGETGWGSITVFRRDGFGTLSMIRDIHISDTHWSSTSSGEIAGFRSDVGNAYVDGTGFRLPFKSPNINNIQWVAFE
ncbi:hypothetical protein AWH56_010700 [Anaerobacillus isosaccharinicus]|uniref:Uncharacterized protein n=1 Tax=Anaerobacillus isosaccharinicus TaxID=1532552 RepID=A0A1S2LA22_9BACI|nr:hypothetical protein [Anaerobacillus isosaccharinicus]MBA5588602.1 hypothetical protein [Anaerobacillus isosaccharinicus]QOY37985.1 hypothetical protein AWH56_010700 [Anaerobacillus isosaccharinicus]